MALKTPDIKEVIETEGALREVYRPPSIPALAKQIDRLDDNCHCAKAFRRAGLWDQASWPDTSDMPSVACMLRDHMNIDGISVADVETGLEDGYTKTLWKSGGRSDLPS